MMKPGQVYLEPFVGAAHVLSSVRTTKRYASDSNPYLIAMYKALQNGWEPPDHISEEFYQKLRITTGKQKQDGPAIPLDENPYPLELLGFAGHACAFGGKWFDGYARDPRKPGFNFAIKGKRSLARQLQYIRDVKFRCCSYDEWEPKNAMVYCDPPYEATTQPYFSKSFDSDKFWDTMRKWSENNIVIISEYSAPDDFEMIASIPTKSKMECVKLDLNRRENIYSKTKYDPFNGIF